MLGFLADARQQGTLAAEQARARLDFQAQGDGFEDRNAGGELSAQLAIPDNASLDGDEASAGSGSSAIHSMGGRRDWGKGVDGLQVTRSEDRFEAGRNRAQQERRCVNRTSSLHQVNLKRPGICHSNGNAQRRC